VVEARMTAGQRREALELEFTRLKERADHIDRVLQGDPDAWLRIKLILEDAKHIGSIELDKSVAEARQTALAMATVAKALAALGEEKEEKPAMDPLAQLESRKAEDELAARRDRKQA
jgi:hypothetical protein